MASKFPSYPGIKITAKRTQVYSTTVVEGESGIEQTTSWRPVPRWRYELQVEFLRATEGEVAEFSQFVDDHRGALRNFYFTDPVDGVDRLVRFDQDEFDLGQVVNGVWDVQTIKLVTVL